MNPKLTYDLWKILYATFTANRQEKQNKEDDFDLCKIFYKHNTNSIYVHVNNFKIYVHIYKQIKFDDNQLNTADKNYVVYNHRDDSNHNKLLNFRIVKYYFKGSFINKNNNIETFIRDKKFSI